ncbi:MAG: metallophosphoesterase [Candidatus Hydrogenedens sp.]|nr:metallophosphoesterase [Candidatus Hydrogenedens sp.]
MRKWGLLLAAAAMCIGTADAEVARGVVYNDENGNGQRDAGERGVKDVCVSNGVDVVQTGRDGSYEISVGDDTSIFVIKPSGWSPPMDHNGTVSRFYYTHKPNGAPDLKYPVVAPTGPLPASVDFPLRRVSEGKQFRMILLGDPQPRDQKEVDWLSHDVYTELLNLDADLGATLGDLMFNGLELYPEIIGQAGLVGVPWFHVIGNHDINFDAKETRLSDETYEYYLGPSYYASDYGKVTFLALNNIWWKPEEREYEGRFGEDQIAFVKNTLAHTDPDNLIVAMMHIPLWDCQDKDALLELLAPFQHTFSVSAHSHIQNNGFIEVPDAAAGHHHLNLMTACGSWMGGQYDETGIPHTMMRDGGPNGHALMHVDGNQYWVEFKAARRPADYQMEIAAPELVLSGDAAATEVVVNFFAGSEKAQLDMRLDKSGDWIPMERFSGIAPNYQREYDRENGLYRKVAELSGIDPADEKAMDKLKRELMEFTGRGLPEPRDTPHLWRAHLPADPAEGYHVIEVRAVDMWGKEHKGQRIVRVKE